MKYLNQNQQYQFKKLNTLYNKLQAGYYNTYYEYKPDLWVFEGRHKKNCVYADAETFEAFKNYNNLKS